MKESDYDYLQEILIKNPDLKEAFFNPVNIGEVSNGVNYPLLICENPDSELPEVQRQINFILPNEKIKRKICNKYQK